MMDEKKFDYENYIQNRLREIDDLDERRFAKELLLNGLGSVFAWTEAKYETLEQRIQKELDVPGNHFFTYMTVVEKKDYDPINTFWFPVCEEDIENINHAEYETIYLIADEEDCQKFICQKTVMGIVEGNGKKFFFQIRKQRKYTDAIKKIYSLFVANHIPWQTIHMGHLDRFYELVPMEELPPDAKVRFQWNEWENKVRQNMVPLWNIQKTEIDSQEFRVPCIDEVLYEHAFYLPDEREEKDGYLIETKEDILSIYYETNRVLLKSRYKSLKDVSIYRMCQMEPPLSFGYQYPILSNWKNDNLAARYLQLTGNFLKTPMELRRKVREMSGSYEIDFEKYGITDCIKEDGKKIIFGDMNDFSGAKVFSNDQRKILLFYFLPKENQADYLYEAHIKYILSQLQMEFMEYRCAGIVVSSI